MLRLLAVVAALALVLPAAAAAAARPNIVVIETDGTLDGCLDRVDEQAQRRHAIKAPAGW